MASTQANPGSSSIRISQILPLPDRRSLITYMLFAGIIPFTYLCLHITGMQVMAALNWDLEIVAALLIFIAWMLRRAGHAKISTGMETITLMFLKASFVIAVQYPLI